MNPEIEKLKTEMQELQEQMKSLSSDATLPRSVEGAFRRRFRLQDFSTIRGSSKSATSENQTVNEAGIASYSVLKAPDAFLEVTVAGSVYYIPIFT